jgi:hypothetical protein
MATFLEVVRDEFGVDRVLGNIAIPDTARRVRYAVSAPYVPEAEWVEFEISDPTPVKDQGSFGACNGFAASSSLELARWMSGQPNVELSPWQIYAELCRGVDRGSNIGEALDLLTKTGTALNSAVPYGTINPRKLTAEARAMATRFRVEIGSKIENFHDAMSCTQLRRPGNLSIAAGRGFGDLDADGVAPVRIGAAGNHAITFGFGAKRAKNGKWLIKWKNSWGTRYGLGGYAWLGADAIDEQRWFEGYSVSAATEDPSDDQEPPPAPEK